MLACVIAAVVGYRGELHRSLKSLDGLVGNVQKETEVAQAVITSASDVSAALQESIPHHRDSLETLGRTSELLAANARLASRQMPGLATTSRQIAGSLDRAAAILPLKLPQLELQTQTVGVEIPTLKTRTRQIKLPYPTATVNRSREEISYPSGASVEMKKWERTLGSIAGKSLGGLSFKYPAGLDVSKSTFAFEYPSSIDIDRQQMLLDVPVEPELGTRKINITVPAQPKLSYREMLEDEKTTLQSASEQLRELENAIPSLQEALGESEMLLSTRLPESIRSTTKLLDESESELQTLHTQTLPVALAELSRQSENLSKTRTSFGRLSGLIDLGFLFGLLLGLACTASGLANLNRNQ